MNHWNSLCISMNWSTEVQTQTMRMRILQYVIAKISKHIFHLSQIAHPLGKVLQFLNPKNQNAYAHHHSNSLQNVAHKYFIFLFKSFMTYSYMTSNLGLKIYIILPPSHFFGPPFHFCPSQNNYLLSILGCPILLVFQYYPCKVLIDTFKK